MKILDTWVGVTRDWCRDRRNEGWDGLIQGAGSGGRAAPLYPTMQRECEGSLWSMRGAGGLTAAYFNTNPWYAPDRTLDDALNAIGGELEHLSFLVIDHELSPEPATESGAHDLDARTHELIQLTRQAAPGIPLIGYSGDWFLGFLGILLGRPATYDLDGYWHARYDNVAHLPSNPPRWWMAEPLVGKQYKGTTILGGKVTDLNVFDDAWIRQVRNRQPIPTPPTPQEDDMTQEEMREVLREIGMRGSPVIIEAGDTRLRNVRIEPPPSRADHWLSVSVPCGQEATVTVQFVNEMGAPVGPTHVSQFGRDQPVVQTFMISPTLGPDASPAVNAIVNVEVQRTSFHSAVVTVRDYYVEHGI